MVGSVERPLQTVLGNARLTYDELMTIRLEIEGTLNSHPLTYEYDGGGGEGEMLTPPHLLYGFRLLSLRRGPRARVEYEREVLVFE